MPCIDMVFTRCSWLLEELAAPKDAEAFASGIAEALRDPSQWEVLMRYTKFPHGEETCRTTQRSFNGASLVTSVCAAKNSA